MNKILIALSIFMGTIANFECVAANDGLEVHTSNLENKSPEFIKYHSLGQRYVQHVNDASTLDDESLKSEISTLYADSLSKIGNDANMLSSDISAQEALFNQLIKARAPEIFGNWHLVKESYLIVPAPEAKIVTVHFTGVKGDGGKFNVMAMLTFNNEDKITKIIETFSLLS